MANHIRQYEYRKQLVLDRLDGLLAGDAAAELLGCNASSPAGAALCATITERRRALDAGEFVVAVAGQMNAGKSSVLNALIFGRDVLPVSPVTMTAKVTRIVHGAPDRVRGIFYTPDEFNRVSNAYTASSAPLGATGRDNAREWEALLHTAAQAGVLPHDVVKLPAKVLDTDQLSTLKELVAVPHRGGKYSPFVNTVEIQSTLPWARSIVFVDTPGISDPNPVREKVTHDWIARADAVLYVSYAGQAGLTQTDKEFIAEHLAHVAPERRVLVVNKCDTVSDPGEIHQFLNDLRVRALHDPAFEFLRSSGEPLLVSARGALVARLRQPPDSTAGNSATTEGWSTWEGSGFEKLSAVVERIVVQESGESVLNAAVRFMLGLTRKAQQHLDRELNRLDEQDAAQQLQADERSALLLESIQARIEIVETIRSSRDDAAKLLRDAAAQWKHELKRLAEHVVKNASEAADKKDVRVWRASMVTAFYNEFSRNQLTIGRTVGELLEPALRRAHDMVVSSLVESTSNRRLPPPIQRQMYDSSAALDTDLATSLERLRAGLHDQFGLTWRNFWSDTLTRKGDDSNHDKRVKAAESAFLDLVLTAFNAVADDIARQFLDSFKLEMAAQAELATNELEKRIDMLERQITETAESRRERSEWSQKRQAEILTQRRALDALAETWAQLGTPE